MSGKFIRWPFFAQGPLVSDKKYRCLVGIYAHCEIIFFVGFCDAAPEIFWLLEAKNAASDMFSGGKARDEWPTHGGFGARAFIIEPGKGLSQTLDMQPIDRGRTQRDHTHSQSSAPGAGCSHPVVGTCVTRLAILDAWHSKFQALSRERWHQHRRRLPAKRQPRYKRAGDQERCHCARAVWPRRGWRRRWRVGARGR